MMSLRVMSPVGRVALSQVVPPSPQQVEEVCVCACMCVCMCVRVCMCVSVCAYLKAYVLMEESIFHYISAYTVYLLQLQPYIESLESCCVEVVLVCSTCPSIVHLMQFPALSLSMLQLHAAIYLLTARQISYGPGYFRAK